MEQQMEKTTVKFREATMIQTVIKRDGRIVGFNEEKIAAAIRKALGEDEKLIAKICDRIAYNGKKQMTVEEIQDAVEKELMKSPRKEVARAYISYRDKRSIARQAKTKNVFMEIIEAKSNDVTRENANMNADTPAGMMMKFASETTKPFVDDYLLSPEVREAVKKGYIHIHDKDYYPTKSLTCVQHPLDKILKYGFSAGHGESRPAKRIETASILGCISMETAQNEMHGGQAIPAFDFYLAPFVRTSFVEEVKVLENLNGEDYSALYDAKIEDFISRPLDGLKGIDRVLQHAINRTVNRVHQSMEAFIHNMNTIHSRGGLWHRYFRRRSLHHPRTFGKHLRRCRQWIHRNIPHPDLEEEARRQLSAWRPQLRSLPDGLQGNRKEVLPKLLESRRIFQPSRKVDSRRPQALRIRGGNYGLPHTRI